MKGIITILVVLFVVCATAVNYRADFYPGQKEKVIKDHYIVIFHPNATTADRLAHIGDIKKKFSPNEKVNHVYEHGTFSGYAGRFEKSNLIRILKNNIVKYVEQDQTVSIEQSCTKETNTAIWHLERIEELTPVYNNEFTYPSNSGTGIFAYVVDTGILISHNDFAPGRAIWGFNAVDSNNVDCNGHGTHVASSIGGVLYGSAKTCTLIAVKVLDCAGSGSYAGVINGINWAASDSKTKGRKSVMNLSLGGGVSAAVDDAVIAAGRDSPTGSNDGVLVVVAAGNSNANACNSSPSGASQKATDTLSNTPFVWSVGATDRNDARATFSNFGAACVNIWAPGVSVTSAWIGSNTATNTISGTSMAAPQVCGVAAWYWSQNTGENIHQLRQSVNANFNTGKINFANCNTNTICSGSHNRLIYNLAPAC